MSAPLSSNLRRLARVQTCLQQQHGIAQPVRDAHQVVATVVRVASSDSSCSADMSFQPDAAGLALALDTLLQPPPAAASLKSLDLPDTLPSAGVGEAAALKRLAPAVLGGAQRLGAADAFAHMYVHNNDL